jgi:peptidyl-prolyl cis-trans isomerase A (cyclophilin A)
MRPSAPELNETAPGVFRAAFETTEGTFVIEVNREWAPVGADRFYNLVNNGFYDDVRFHRVIEGFMVQFGVNGTPLINAQWRKSRLADDPVVESNTRGRVTYAKTQTPNSRTTQIFISFGDNSNLDALGFAPFGEVVEGMDVVEALYSGYGESQPSGNGPYPPNVHAGGNEYLEEFPELSYIVSATIQP